MSTFYPNTYLAPNAYVDHLMYLLTDTEWKVLSYAIRQIMGWEANRANLTDDISISQFCNGKNKTDKDGRRVDNGTGLGRTTVIKALAGLVKYRVMVELRKGTRRGDSTRYKLQLESEKVDWDGLRARYEERQATHKKRTAAGTRALRAKREIEGGSSDEPGTTGSWHEPAGGSLDEPDLVRGTNQQKYKRETQEKSGASAPEPPSPSDEAKPSENGDGKTNGKARERDLLWDAVVLVTGLDSNTAGETIGGVVKKLRKGKPAYTPEEVQAAYKLWQADDRRNTGKFMPPWLLPVWIGRTRAKPAASSQKFNTVRF